MSYLIVSFPRHYEGGLLHRKRFAMTEITDSINTSLIFVDDYKNLLGN
ncbi:MAG: hypothetical protein LBL79_10730 [Prevotella sp.]|jgi:hypothetical protein|nr:hypothetical protein [Prevotella sp.]